MLSSSRKIYIINEQQGNDQRHNVEDLIIQMIQEGTCFGTKVSLNAIARMNFEQKAKNAHHQKN